MRSSVAEPQLKVLTSEGNRGLETRGNPSPSPKFGEHSGWGQLFKNVLGNFGDGDNINSLGNFMTVPENPRTSGTGTKTTFKQSPGTGRGLEQHKHLGKIGEFPGIPQKSPKY